MAEDRAAERGAPGIYLHVERSNEAAIALYEGSGFKKQPNTPYYASFSNALELRFVEPLLLYKPLEAKTADVDDDAARSSTGRSGGAPTMHAGIDVSTRVLTGSRSRARGVCMLAWGRSQKKSSDSGSFDLAAPPPATPSAEAADDGETPNVAATLLSAGLKVEQIRQMIIAEGASPEEAERLIQEASATAPGPSASSSLPETTGMALEADESAAGEPTAGATPWKDGNPIATFTTSLGLIQCEIFVEACPLTASNFVDLAESGFYDGLHFHRVIPAFMDQFGCPNSRDPDSPSAGTGGPAAGSTFKHLVDGSTRTRLAGGNIEDEFSARIPNDAGTLSMANTGEPNSGGSQFFMNVNDNTSLDWFSAGSSRHPVFGKCIDQESFDVMVAISQVPTNTNDRPLTPVRVEKVSIATPGSIQADEAALFEEAVAAAREAKRQAQEEVERAIARPAFKTEEQIVEERKDWVQKPLQNYISAMVDPSQTLATPTASAAAAPETTAERAATEARQIKEASLRKQALEEAPASGPAAFFMQALNAAGNIQAAAAAALKESNEKAAAATAAAGSSKKPRGNLKKLYKQLDAAIDADDFETAGEIKRQIDELKKFL